MKVQQITEALAEIDNIDSGKSRKNVVILGAGMAGLVAAYELSRLGHTVEIIEAQNRVGGRAFTHRFNDKDYHELGAMRIPSTHGHTLYYIEKCGLKTRRFINHHDDHDSFYFIRGIASTHKDALLKIVPNFRLSCREREIIEKAGTPIALMSVLGEAIDKITKSPENMDALFAQGPMTAYVKELESQTLYDYLRSHLDTEDAVELVGAVTGLEVWWSKAVTMILRDEISQAESTGLVEIIGGTDLLPTTLRDQLALRPNVTITLKTKVSAIFSRADRVQLKLQSQEKVSDLVCRDADFVICTIPFGCLRRIELHGLSSGKMRAIRNLTYASSTKVLLHCGERFWESEKYGIFGAGSQMDLINRQIYYPSDTAEPGPVKSKSKLASALLAYEEHEKTQKPKSSTTKLKSGVLVGSYCWGSDARRLGALPCDERTRVVADCVAEIHPEIWDNDMIQAAKTICWDQFDWSVGAFCFMRPGDLELYYKDTIKPEGHLFFAGEHCSLDQGWMQGAIESAIRTVHGLVAFET